MEVKLSPNGMFFTIFSVVVSAVLQEGSHAGASARP